MHFMRRQWRTSSEQSTDTLHYLGTSGAYVATSPLTIVYYFTKYVSAFNQLKYSNSIRRTCNPPRNLQRNAAHKKGPPPQLLALPTQRLKIKHLPNRTPPASQQPLVQQSTPLHLLLPGLALPSLAEAGVPPRDGRLLEARRVAGDGGEFAVPDPAQRVRVGCEAEVVWLWPFGMGFLFCECEVVVGGCKADSD